MVWPRILRWGAIALLGVLVLIVALVFGINTQIGRRVVATQIGNLAFASGLNIRIGRIDGSLYGTLQLRDVRMSDARGVFATLPIADVDWRPLAYLQNRIDIRSATAPSLRVLRAPTLKPGDPNAPLLPSLDIAVGQFKIDRIVLEAQVAQTRRIAAIDAAINITDGHAVVRANASSPDGGDRVTLALDAVPDKNRFVLVANLVAPANGVIAQTSGLNRPISAKIDGRGTWARWAGTARAQSGNASIADLAITARSGTYGVRGVLQPGVLVAGPVQRLSAGGVRLDAQATLANRVATFTATAGSQAITATTSGTVDLARSTFSNVALRAALLTPGTIADNLSGRGVVMALTASGRFATPLIDYRLSADAIGFGTTVVRGLVATGASRWASTGSINTATIPVNARAASIEGLNDAAGDVLRDVTIKGNFVRTGDTFLADDLAVRSRRLTATALVVADISTGMYRGAINGRVNDYELTGVGAIDLTSDIKIIPARSGYGLDGRIAIETRRIDSEGVRDFLGGRLLGRARVGFAPSGVFSVSDVRAKSPGLTIADGGGTVSTGGAISFAARGLSRAYGPLGLTVNGTIDRQLIRVRAPRPRVGIQFTGVDALITRTAAGYAIKASGGSDYGPVSADVTVLGGTGPLTVDIVKARLSNIDFAGRICQSSAGPFEGTLSAVGDGLTGKVQLARAGKIQRVDGQMRAENARIDGNNPITIQRALIDGSAILYEKTPQVNANIQLAGVTQGETSISAARGRIAYRGGAGTVHAVIQGTRGRPFKIGITTQLSPSFYRTAAQGSYGGIAFRTAQPAIVRVVKGNYLLEPAVIKTQQGEVTLSGRYGNTVSVNAQASDFDLAIINAFDPRAAIGGRVTGTFGYTQNGGATPAIDARFNVARFTRTGAFTLATPVDVRGIAQLSGSGGRFDAVINRGTRAIGRIAARTAGNGDDFMTAALSGGVRYNGPAETLWSLTGQSDQQLSGPIGIAADLGGSIEAPRLTGVVRANGLIYDNDTYGTRVNALKIDGRFSNDSLDIASFSGRAGGGSVAGSGRIGLSASEGFPYRIAAKLINAQLARSDTLGASVSGDVVIANSLETGATMSGDLVLPTARYVFVRQGASDVIDLAGVRRKGAAIATPEQARVAANGAPGLFTLDLRIRADRRVFVEGMGLEAEWATDLRVRGTSADPQVTGDVTLVRGTYGFAGRRFDLDQTSKILFRGGTATDPQLVISARTAVNGVTATINIGGTAQRPQIVFGSTPTLPQDEVLSRLLFGGSVTQLSATQALQLAASLNSLRGTGGGLNPLGMLRSATGISRLRVLGADEATGRGTAIAAGQYISNGIFIEIITDTRGFTATQLEISLSRALSILSQVGGSGNTNATIRYSRDY